MSLVEGGVVEVVDLAGGMMSGTTDGMMIEGAGAQRVEGEIEVGAGVALPLQEEVVALCVKVLQRGGQRLSSGIVNERSVKLLKLHLLVLLGQHHETLHLLMTISGGFFVVCVANLNFFFRLYVFMYRSSLSFAEQAATPQVHTGRIMCRVFVGLLT